MLAASPAVAQTVAEPIEPDRPDVTNGTHIVDNGLLQVEMGGIFTRAAPGERAFGSPFTARLGLLDWLEVRFGGDGWLSQTSSDGSASGFGNLEIGAKLRLWDEPGGVPVLSILPNVSIPTASASKDLGSGDADYTVTFLTGTDIGRRGHVDVNYGIGAIGAGGGAPHFVQHVVSVSASMTATPKWNPYVEAFWYSREEAGHGPTTAVDAGAIYIVSPRFAIDGGLQCGLTTAADDFAAFAGISVVVGDILGGHGVHRRAGQAPKPKRAPKPARRS